MKPRFETDSETSERPTPPLVDPEAYDASEQQFAASLENTARPRFQVDSEGETSEATEVAAPLPASSAKRQVVGAEQHSRAPEPSVAPLIPDSTGESRPIEPPAMDGSWRDEVAARVHKYRTRHTRAPRYPSLQLKFEIPEPVTPTPRIIANRSVPPVASQLAISGRNQLEVSLPEPAARTLASSDATARIIEFPRPQVLPFDELAEPVLDRPRILEAPELLPSPPALGGILIEPSDPVPRPHGAGFELPLQTASISRRLTAALIDAIVVLCASAVFGIIFLRTASFVPQPRTLLGPSAILLGLFWISYQYLLMVYCATTPGLRLTRVVLSCFDGRAVARTTRRWRVAASVLSGMSLALGYAWCFLDEDQLCWHDRITRTYLVARPK